MEKWFEKAVPKTDRKVFWTALISGLLLFGLDQLTKEWVVHGIPYGSRHSVIPGFFNLTYVTNTGAAWGILSGRYWLLLSVSGVVFIAASIFLQKLTEGWTERYFAVFLVLSGILGNCIDRIFRGAVVDFLQFFIRSYAWPSFNVADSCICIGVGIYILSTLLRPEHRDRNQSPYVHSVKS